MKKILCLTFLAILLMTGSALAEKWTTANQITVAWDPITVSSGIVSYKIYYKPISVPTPETMYAEKVADTQITMTFANEGRYYVGVRSVRTVDGIDLEASTISWSNDPLAVLNGETFGIQYYNLPNSVGGIKVIK